MLATVRGAPLLQVAERPEAPPAKKSLADLSVDELEAELAARKAKQNS